MEVGDYPEQPTSWNGVYHVLQRYGAYTALKRFTDVFDDGDMFVGSVPVAPVPESALPPQPPARDRGARLQY